MTEIEELEYEIATMYEIIDILLERIGMTFDEYLDSDDDDSDEHCQVLVMLVQVNAMCDRLELMEQKH